MTYEEALKRLRYEIEEEGHCSFIEDEIEVAFEALKKQIPQKPNKRDLWELATATGHSCPNCGNDFPIGIYKPYKYCPDCGQAIK
jgi:ribosomal protein S27AE